MPAFKYKARNPEGRVLEGQIEGDNEDSARAILRGRKLSVMEIGKVEGRSMFRRGPKVKKRDIVLFSRQLATMVSSGLTVPHAISIMADQVESKEFRAVLTQVRDEITGGVNISEALAKFPTVFEPLYVHMVEAGEKGGALEVILARLSDYLEKAEALKSRIQSAMIYPAAIATVAISVVIFLMVKVIPSFKTVFDGFGAELPVPTKILLGVSDFFQQQILVILGGIGGVVGGIIMLRRTEAGTRATDALMLKMPLFGTLLLKFAVARFSRTLGTLMSSAVHVLEALEIVAKTAGNKVIEAAVMRARNATREGESIGAAMASTAVFPPMVIQMIRSGEETGRIDEMLIKIADFYDQEVDTAVEAMMKLIEPLMMVVMGGTVGLIVLGMFMPMFEMSQAVGG